MKMEHFSLQKKLGIIISVGGIIVLITNFIKYYQHFNGNLYDTISYLSVWLLALLIIPFIFSIFYENKFLKILHVFVFLIISFVDFFLYDYSTSMPYELVYGYVFLIIGFLIAFKYGFFKKYFYTKIIIFISLTIVMIFVARSSFGDHSVNPYYDTLAELIFLTIFLLFLFIIYSDDIKKYISENKKMKDHIEQNSTYVDFGKNFSNLSHNMRGLISNMSSSVELMSKVLEDIDETKTNEVSDRNLKSLKLIHTIQKRNIDILVSNINTSSALVKMNNIINENEEVKVKLLLNEIVTMHSINPFRKNMLVLKYEDNIDNLLCKTSSSMIVNIIENLITNAMQAMSKVEEPFLLVQSFEENGYVYVSLTDKGPGFKYCEKPCNHDCINCERYRIGKTTKYSGSGQGIVFIQKALKKVNGKFEIKSSKEGSTVIVGFPIIK